MGLTVNSFLKENLKGINTGRSQQHLSKYANNKNIWIVDVSLFLHRILRNNNTSENQHISGFLNLIAKLRSFKIHPIFVFDGKPSKHKKKKLTSRRKTREKSWKKKEELEKIIADCDEDLSSSIESLPENLQIEIQNKIIEEEDKNCDTSESVNPKILEDITLEIVKKEQIKLAKRCIKKTESHYNDLKELFDYFELAYVHLEDQEADVVCYSLSIAQELDFKVDCILSNDMDFLAYHYDVDSDTDSDSNPDSNSNLELDILMNSSKDSDKKNKVPKKRITLIRDFNFQNDFIEENQIRKMRENLNLTNEQFTDFCILMGTDYNKALGMDFTADIIYDLICKYKSIENILNYFKTLEKYKKIYECLISEPNNYQLIIKKFEMITEQPVETQSIEEIINYLKNKISEYKKIDTKFSYIQSRNIFRNSVVIKSTDIHNYSSFLNNYSGKIDDNYKFKVKKGIKFIKDKCYNLKYVLVEKKIKQIYKHLQKKDYHINSYQMDNKNYKNTSKSKRFSNWKSDSISQKNTNQKSDNQKNNIQKSDNQNINSKKEISKCININHIDNNTIATTDNIITTITNNISNSNNTTNQVDLSGLNFVPISESHNDKDDTVLINDILIESKDTSSLYLSSKSEDIVQKKNSKRINNCTSPISYFNKETGTTENLFVEQSDNGFISISINKKNNNIIGSTMCYV